MRVTQINYIMKNYLVAFLICGFLLTSCSDEDNLNKSFSDFNFVAFNSASSVLTVQEDEGTFSIDVTLSAPVATDTQLSIVSTDDTAIGGVHYSFTNETITIPAGAYSGSFQLLLVDDDAFNESRIFNIELSLTSATIQKGLLGNTATFSKTIVIVNDDCPTNYNVWFGALTVEDVGFDTTPGTGSATPNGTCDLLRVLNDMPAIGGNTTGVYDIALVPFVEGGTSGTATVEETVARTGIANAANGPLDAIYSATGFYDEASKTITLNYTLAARNGAGAIIGNFYTGTNVIVKP